MESKSILIQPKIVEHEAFSVVGIFTHGDPKTIDYDEVWREFIPYADRLLRLSTDKAYYNVYIETDDGMVDLIAGMSVKSGPFILGDLRICQIPAGRYAMFGCLVDSANVVYNYIDNKWLPSSKYEQDDRPSFEYFSPRTRKAFTMLIYIPIKERK